MEGRVIAECSSRTRDDGHPVDISVIICTYNRSESLRRTLQVFCDLEIPCGVTWELLVVDNNSKDATRMVCNDFAARLPLRYLFEASQGQSNALNRGVEEAKAGLLLFTDDDVDVEPLWLVNFLNVARRHLDVSYFGGKIIPRWEITPPQWFSDNADTLLKHVASAFEMGESEVFVTPSDCVFYGANLAIRKHVFLGTTKFRPDLGPCGVGQVRGGETALLRELLSDGHKGLYTPSMVVHHRNASSRMTESYVRAYFHGAGVTEVRMNELRNDYKSFLGAPRYLWLKLTKHALQYAMFRWTRPSPIWLRAEIEMATSWGRITELRRLHRRPDDRSRD